MFESGNAADFEKSSAAEIPISKTLCLIPRSLSSMLLLIGVHVKNSYAGWHGRRGTLFKSSEGAAKPDDLSVVKSPHSLLK